ncbi:SIR2 family protein [Mesorhizobium sp. M0239]|uniref:P-loop NTPase n=1 Tax=Mesorhizobium sp. M0239 TaxID=2956924 RepID=UPI003335AD85
MRLDSGDEAFLIKSIMQGDALLILGAGASISSKNSYGQPVKTGGSLARLFAERAALPYDSETLTEVVSAIRGQYLSDVQIVSILTKEYKGTFPSDELVSLLQVCWKRVYTFNYDDSIENIQKRTAQIRRYYNGMVDSAAEFEGPRFLHVVHLHGDINKPEYGFVLSDTEYSKHIISNKNYWYERAGQDYISSCPIFIGTSINEPILLAEIERAKSNGRFSSGRGYVVTPDKLSLIKKEGLKSKGLVHIEGTLKDFAAWVKSAFPNGNDAREVVAKANEFGATALNSITASDIDVAHSLYPISVRTLAERLKQMRPGEEALMGRQFLQGFPPSWMLAASKVPVRLEAFESLKKELFESIERGDRLFVATGQAGSGKTTATMMAILDYASDNPEVPIYEMSRDVVSTTKAFSLLNRLHGERCIVFAGDLFVYGDGFSDSLLSIKAGSITVVSSSRTGEWIEHLSRYLGEFARPALFQRFVRRDYDPLIDRLVEYVPAPRFRKMTRLQQHAELAKSKSQLLIALREATDSQNFDDIITNEFEKLPDADTRRLLLIVGVSTLARIGVSADVAREAYSKLKPTRTFDKALEALDGIVSYTESKRLIARHDLYVRHIFDEVANFDDIRDAIRELLRTYIKYAMPIVKHVHRQDAQLFRFILNHTFVSEITQRKGRDEDGSVIYSDFETDFQLDGHYWLQYGLYLAAQGNLTEAVAMMQRSISAYSGNPYAVHALADLQLRSARQRLEYDTVTRDLIDIAVKTLRIMDSQQSLKTDQYPIVTLSVGHVGALVKHSQPDLAKKFAKEYYERVKFLSRNVNSSMLDRAEERLFRYITLGDWGDSQSAAKSKSGRQAKHRR